MKNRTESNDSPEQIVQITDELITVTKPAWLSAEQWEQTKMLLQDGLDQVVERITGRCRDYAWCTMPRHVGGHEEHQQYHAGDPVDLVPAVDTDDRERRVTGWWAWPVYDRDHPNGEPTIMLEGAPGGDGARTSQFDTGSLYDLLAATSTPKARKALQQLVDEMIGSA